MANIQGGTNYAGVGASTLTSLIPIIYRALDVVAREQVGLLKAATRDVRAETAALGQTLRSPVTQPTSITTIVPSNVSPNTGGQTLVFKDLVLTNSQAANVQWTGEEQKAVGDLYVGIVQQQFEQAFRTLSNTVEASLVSTMTAGSYFNTLADSPLDVGGCSRAYGTAGTTPFAWDQSNFSTSMVPFGQLHLILDNNGCPEGNRHLVISQKAFANIRSMPNLYKANEADTDQMLREGIVLMVEGFKFHKSNQLDNHPNVAGTGSGYTATGTGAANGSQYVVGETVITVGAGTGTILSGNTITWAGDPNIYVVASGLASSKITLAAPGLQQPLSNGVAGTLGGSYTANIAFDPVALMLGARLPIMPTGGDAATDVVMVFDPLSGLTYQIAEYRQYRQIHYEIGLAWGSMANKPEFASLLLG